MPTPPLSDSPRGVPAGANIKMSFQALDWYLERNAQGWG